VPKIVDDANGDQIRVWVPGCATGEEAYSLAMLFDQYCRRYRPDTRVKVFATDIHQKSLELASGGIFPAERVEHLSAELQETYFSPINDGEYRIEKELRQMVIFAPHNLTQDPPFTKLDLISCRNVLIYFRAPTQKKIMSYFHFGLKQGGYLMLGPSEHLNELKDEFSIIDRRWRIYRKQRDVRLLQTPSMGQRRQRPLLSDPLLATTLVEQRLQQGTQNAQLQSWQNKLLEKYVPPSLLVNRNFELKHVFGDAGEYLRQMRGQVTTDVLKMVKSDLHTALRAALHRASRDGESVAYKGIRISAEDGSSHYVELSAEPFASQYDKESYVLVTIEALDEPVQPPPPIEALNLNEASGDQIDLLERELQYTREHLQATVEELETTNEELQSTNEELIASNEELQSTNEELHSVNEELYTVNTEYQHKINELLQVTNDMQNLQNSTQIATIFLDPEHRIRNFTPSAGTTFNLLPQDIGRPIEHLLYNLNLSRNALRTITDDVLQNRTAIDQEVMLPTNHEYLMRVRPYETDANLVAGVVFSFIDIAHSKQVERSQTEQSTLVQKLYDITSHPSTTIQQQLNYALEVATDALGLNMGVISCVEGAVCHMDLVHAPAGEIAVNDAFVFAETYCNVTLSQDGVIAIHHVGTTSWQEHAAYLKFGLETHIGTRVFVNGNCYGALNFSQTEPREVPFTAAERDFVRQLGVWVGSMLELRITNETLKATSAELSTIVHTIHLPIIHLNAERVITFVNAPFLELFGYDNEEVVGQPVRLLYPSDDAYDAWTKKVKGLGASMDRQRINIELRDKGGSTFMVQMIRSALTDANGEVAGYVGIMVETALYRQQAISLAETTRRFEAVFNYASQFIGLVAPDGTLLEANKTALDFANLTRADVINKPFWDALWWQHSPAINQQLRDAIKRAAAGEFMRYPVDVLGVGGHTVTIDFSLNPITDADGKVIYLIPEGRILG
ncbi:MAG: CheR family methyltransferase, partial [Candidatus Promineifilaceae bacterium]